jgi:hypothetical protein
MSPAGFARTDGSNLPTVCLESKWGGVGSDFELFLTSSFQGFGVDHAAGSVQIDAGGVCSINSG